MTQPRVVSDERVSLLYDASRHATAEQDWFERDYWLRNGRIVQETSGRGSVLVVAHESETWVLRHYHRGGFVARLVTDHYVWLGLERTRSFREWRLLASLRDAGLPAPNPIAARVVRTGAIYTADIITTYLPDTRKLSAYIADGQAPAGVWTRIGEMLRAFHLRGVDHPDLTAHNVLLGSASSVFLVDFDNARQRLPGPWSRMGLARFERSLRKVALETGTEFDARAWQLVRRAYSDDAT
jgi:3-deoxy-D-manno-octulosonic acid kinase